MKTPIGFNDRTVKPFNLRNGLATFVIVMLGCVADPAHIAAPSRNLEVALSAEPSSAKTVDLEPVSCALAVRISDLKYRAKNVIIAPPSGVVGTSHRNLKFVFAAWQRQGTELSRLATCEIPDTPQAIAYFKNVFGKGRAPTAWKISRHALSKNSNRTEDATTLYDDVDETTCSSNDPIGFGCSCGEGTCSGWNASTLLDGDMPPAGDLGPSEILAPATPDYDPTLPSDTIRCTLQSENIHMSTKFSSSDQISVHGWTDCDHPLLMTVEVVLKKEVCLDSDIIFFCWFPIVADSGPQAKFGFVEDANAKTACSPGWYYAETTHRMVFGLNRNPRTGNYSTFSNWRKITYWECAGAI